MHSGPTLVRRGLAAALALGLAAGLAPRAVAAQDADGAIAIAIHGGAGTIRRGDMTPEAEKAYRAKLEEALRAGYAVLEDGGTSLDAVVAAITVMEDSPLFNAGKGAVFTNAGTNELDAAIMDGATLRAGAVAGVKTVKNPILLARAVMERSPHVMLAGAGAEAFAAEQGLELVDPEYFFTQHRWDALQRIKAEEAGKPVSEPQGPQAFFPDDRKFGTVGAVALDRHGNLAAGTSTGGMTNKRWGRIGDSPIIGAGTYANNASCAVSATGHGEYFIRNVVAHDICARVEYGGQTLEEAANYVVMQ
ncbi:MAG TPA: isoaspartyl peptidase/L-asparaginase, partial [Longimicrobiales bacterium]